jgi:D-3-phosphoglycerate dehydrogenase / 2-oxoglutarate reductase
VFLNSKLKVVITDFQFPGIDIEERIVSAAGGVLAAYHCTTEQDVVQAASEADALLVQWAPITRAVIGSLDRCKVIVRYGIGLDNIDLEAARDRGIMVRNVPDYCIDEVADHTFALAMCLARQIPMIDRRIRSGIWKIVPDRPMLASREATFATIGYGRIAREVLKRARVAGFKTATCDPYLPTDVELPNDILRLDFEMALRTADILSLNLPLTRETRHMLDASALKKMKSTSIVINTARGALIDTVALADALNSSKIQSAGIDVFETEPLEHDHPLRNCENAVLTSHVSWYSELSGPTLQLLAAQEAVRVLQTRTSDCCD